MNFDYEVILFYVLATCGIIALLDVIFLAPKRNKSRSKKMPMIIEYARSFFPLLLIVFSVRSFGFEPRRIPSGSLKPTLLVGDFILVNKFNYGIRLPIIHTKIIPMNEPKRGDIVVFRGPSTFPHDMVKRVVGVPGDRISYIDKVLYINGQQIPQEFKKFSTDQHDNTGSWEVTQKQENLLGIEHDIYQISNTENDDFHNVVVPDGKYFMMGDNRDDSADSRSWGFMPEEKIIGKATRVLISWDTPTHPVRWERVGSKII